MATLCTELIMVIDEDTEHLGSSNETVIDLHYAPVAVALSQRIATFTTLRLPGELSHSLSVYCFSTTGMSHTLRRLRHCRQKPLWSRILVKATLAPEYLRSVYRMQTALHTRRCIDEAISSRATCIVLVQECSRFEIRLWLSKLSRPIRRTSFVKKGEHIMKTNFITYYHSQIRISPKLSESHLECIQVSSRLVTMGVTLLARTPVRHIAEERPTTMRPVLYGRAKGRPQKL